METRKKENREEGVADLALDGFRVHYSEVCPVNCVLLTQSW
jgi:hypothetical protein